MGDEEGRRHHRLPRRGDVKAQIFNNLISFISEHLHSSSSTSESHDSADARPGSTSSGSVDSSMVVKS